MREVKLMKYYEDYDENYDDEYYGEEYRDNEITFKQAAPDV